MHWWIQLLVPFAVHIWLERATVLSTLVASWGVILMAVQLLGKLSQTIHIPFCMCLFMNLNEEENINLFLLVEEIKATTSSMKYIYVHLVYQYLFYCIHQLNCHVQRQLYC